MEGSVLEHSIPPAAGVRGPDRHVFILPGGLAGASTSVACFHLQQYSCLSPPVKCFQCSNGSVAGADSPFLGSWVMLIHRWPLLLECCYSVSPQPLRDAAAHTCFPCRPCALVAHQSPFWFCLLPALPFLFVLAHLRCLPGMSSGCVAAFQLSQPP